MQIERTHDKVSGSQWIKSSGLCLSSPVSLADALRPDILESTQAPSRVFPAPSPVRLTLSPGNFIFVRWNSSALVEMKNGPVEVQQVPP